MEDNQFNYSEYSISDLKEAIRTINNDKFPEKIKYLKELLKDKIRQKQNIGLTLDSPEFRQLLESYINEDSIALSGLNNIITVKSQICYSSKRFIILLILFTILIVAEIYFFPPSVYLLLLISATLFRAGITAWRTIKEIIVNSKIVSIDLTSNIISVTNNDTFINRHADFFNKFDHLHFSCRFEEILRFYKSTDMPGLISLQTKGNTDIRLLIVRNRKFSNDLISFLNSLLNKKPIVT